MKARARAPQNHPEGGGVSLPPTAPPPPPAAGYGGEMAPNPDCFGVNLGVAIQSVVMVLINTSMMGVVFARFSSPMHRPQNVQFSRSLALHVAGGQLCLSCRVANMKSHGMLQPRIRMFVTSVVIEDLQRERHRLGRAAPSQFQELMDVDEAPAPGVVGPGPRGTMPVGPPLGVTELEVRSLTENLLHLTLGLPATLTHVIDEKSPFYGLTEADIAEQGLEVMVLLEGVDAATSHMLQARRAYVPADMRFGHQFARVVRVRARQSVEGGVRPGAAMGSAPGSHAEDPGSVRGRPGLSRASVRLHFEHFDATVDADGRVHGLPSSRGAAEGGATDRLASFWKEKSSAQEDEGTLGGNSSRQGGFQVDGMGAADGGKGALADLATEQGPYHAVLRIPGGTGASVTDDDRARAVWEILSKARNPVALPTLVLCRLKPTVRVVADFLRKQGLSGVLCPSDAVESEEGRVTVPEAVRDGQATVVVAWVGHARELIERHIGDAALLVHSHVPAPHTYMDRATSVRPRGSVFILSGGSMGEREWEDRIRATIAPVSPLLTLDMDGDRSRIDGLVHTSQLGHVAESGK